MECANGARTPLQHSLPRRHAFFSGLVGPLEAPRLPALCAPPQASLPTPSAARCTSDCSPRGTPHVAPPRPYSKPCYRARPLLGFRERSRHALVCLSSGTGASANGAVRQPRGGGGQGQQGREGTEGGGRREQEESREWSKSVVWDENGTQGAGGSQREQAQERGAQHQQQYTENTYTAYGAWDSTATGTGTQRQQSQPHSHSHSQSQSQSQQQSQAEPRPQTWWQAQADRLGKQWTETRGEWQGKLTDAYQNIRDKAPFLPSLDAMPFFSSPAGASQGVGEGEGEGARGGGEARGGATGGGIPWAGLGSTAGATPELRQLISGVRRLGLSGILFGAISLLHLVAGSVSPAADSVMDTLSLFWFLFLVLDMALTGATWVVGAKAFSLLMATCPSCGNVFYYSRDSFQGYMTCPGCFQEMRWDNGQFVRDRPRFSRVNFGHDAFAEDVDITPEREQKKLPIVDVDALVRDVDN